MSNTEPDHSYNVLLDSLKSVFNTYVNNLWKVIGFFLVAFGWIIANEDAVKYLGSHYPIKIIMLLVIVLSVLGWQFIAIKNQRLTHKLSDRLANAWKEDPCEAYKVGWWTHLINAIAVVALAAQFFWAVFTA